jgi:hypothetical protein
VTNCLQARLHVLLSNLSHIQFEIEGNGEDRTVASFPLPFLLTGELLQQLGDFLLQAVGLGQSRDAGLGEDFILGQVGAGLGVVRSLN